MPETELVLPTAWGQLSGTLTLPEGDGPWTTALLVAGSGPTDRDGNTPLLPAAIDNLKRLAHALARRGIASVRYDKRGVGRSSCPGLREESLRFEHLVDDAALLAGHLAQDGRIGRLLLAGHSEGALVALLAAQGMPVAAVACIAGAGAPASSVMRQQIDRLLPPELGAQALATLDALARQQPVPRVPDELLLLFRPSVQPYLMSWFRHDPRAVLARLDIPVLLMHGSADAQVGADHARRLHAGRPGARLCIVDGMDHLLALNGEVAAGAEAIATGMAEWLQELQDDPEPQRTPWLHPNPHLPA